MRDEGTKEPSPPAPSRRERGNSGRGQVPAGGQNDLLRHDNQPLATRRSEGLRGVADFLRKSFISLSIGWKGSWPGTRAAVEVLKLDHKPDRSTSFTTRRPGGHVLQ